MAEEKENNSSYIGYMKLQNMISSKMSMKYEDISSRRIIPAIKSSEDMKKILYDSTSFLEKSGKVGFITENKRIYYFMNMKTDVVCCPYCGDECHWNSRDEIKAGYGITCGKQECNSKQKTDKQTGCILSEKRYDIIDKWQDGIKSEEELSDKVIIEKINHMSELSHITNVHLRNYLETRFSDSDSFDETYYRIKNKIYEKPVCKREGCTNTVKWSGKKSKRFTDYCCRGCVMKDDEVRKRRTETIRDRWGADNVFGSELFKEQTKERYGVKYLMQRKDVREKIKNTNIERYGCETVGQNKKAQKKKMDTVREKYGVDNVFQTEEVKEKAERTNMEKYGVKNVSYSEEIRKRAKETYYEKTGFSTPFKNPDIRKKSFEKLIKNSHEKKSNKEDEVYEIIKKTYPDIVRNYRTDDFPFNVDFYIPSLDLRIEYQGSQFHNLRAYFGDKKDIEDVKCLYNKMIDSKRYKEGKGKSSQYGDIIYVWTDLDVRKRELALNNKLNYLEIYSYDNEEDINNQLYMYETCLHMKNPLNNSGTNMKNEYMEYLDMNITDFDDINHRYSKNLIIKNFQFCEFYKEEMRIYAENPVLRRKVIQNRMKYLKKKESELNLMNIIRGFKISGIHYGYSHFNPQYTNWFVKKYNIKTIYDPCGGWGHHMLGMLSCDKIIYNELDSSVCSNMEKMKEHFNIENLYINNGDGSRYEPENVDAFFMCPPYYNIEIYNGNEYKSLDEYGRFLNLIFNIWKKNSAKLFGIVLREDFVNLINCKYSEKYMLDIQKSHFEKTNSKKKYNEYFYIFRK